MSCGELFLKSASSTFTGYFVIVSIAFVVYGLTSTHLFLVSVSEETLAEEYVAVPSAALILFGIILLVFIIFGCCSICREIPCCLETYSILLTILSVTQIALGTFCLIRFTVTNVQFAERIRDDVFKMYMAYKDHPVQLDSTQAWLGCCGIDGPRDWVNNTTDLIPSSCCSDEDPSCGILSPTKFSDGCAYSVWIYICRTNYITGWTLIIVGITEVIAAMLGISLSCAYWRNSRIVWL